jgi:hypothetical protein
MCVCVCVCASHHCTGQPFSTLYVYMYTRVRCVLCKNFSITKLQFQSWGPADTYTHTYTYTHTHIHTHKHTHIIHTYTHTYIHTYTHTHVRLCHFFNSYVYQHICIPGRDGPVIASTLPLLALHCHSHTRPLYVFSQSHIHCTPHWVLVTLHMCEWAWRPGDVPTVRARSYPHIFSHTHTHTHTHIHAHMFTSVSEWESGWEREKESVCVRTCVWSDG